MISPRSARAVGVVLAILVSGCTPTAHRLRPYRDDPAKSEQLVRRAADVCWQHRWMSIMPPHAFTTDGCSMWLDGTWVECCVEHDIAYWCGGSAQDRKEADRALSECVAEGGLKGVAWMMYLGVRVGGTPWQPFPWRWGYGFEGFRGYEVLE